MGKAIQAAIAEYKKTKQEARLKKRFFALDLDYNYLRNLLNAMAEDRQRLKFVIHLPNGTILEICRDEQKPKPLKDPFVETIKS